MDTLLLATKLRIPPYPRHAVPRARLIAALDGGVPDFKLTLVSAPAGYGKTTLLAQWAHAGHMPVAWLSLSAEDNDLERFFRYLLAGWDKVQPGINESVLGLLLAGRSPDRQAVLSAFVNVASDTPNPLAFVLDDYHLIEEPAIHHALSFLLDHLPPKFHVVLAARSEPALPLARYRARGELLELRADDLQFQDREAAEFLNRQMQLALTDEELATVHARAEGWIAGLQLAALTLQRHRAPADQLMISGRHRFIADYLSGEVLSHLPEAVRRFLLQTSLLDRLCGALCDAVTQHDGGQQMLELLERENLFLVPLDDRREWFRYHPLFADFLRGEFQRRHPDEVAVVHRRAARWHLDHDLPEQAFHHALAGEDVELVSEIASRYVPAKLLASEITVVERWLDAIPEAWYASHPELGLHQATLWFLTGAYDAAVRRVDEVEQKLGHAESERVRRQLARVAAIRCLIACSRNDVALVESLANQALHELPTDDDLTLRPSILVALGDAYRHDGRWEEAKTAYLKVLEFTRAPAVRFWSVHLHGALADLELRQGHLRQAAAHWRQALAVIEDQAAWGRYSLPVIGWVYIRLAEILYEWNELAEAGDRLSQGMERAELSGDVRALMAGCLITARLKLTAGDMAAAGACLERARALGEKASFPDWAGRFERLQLEFWLAQGRRRVAVDWADKTLRGNGPAGSADGEGVQLAVARVLIAQGDSSSAERALAVLAPLLQAAAAEGRTGVQIEALALQALTCWRQGEHARAMTSVERALRLAEPEGYMRLFADLGLPMARLLQEARARAVMPDFIATLLAALPSDPAGPALSAKALPESLTSREREILALLAAGLTNREIGEKLVISPETVKKHTGTIFGKLGVSNRTEAAARARALNLLD